MTDLRQGISNRIEGPGTGQDFDNNQVATLLPSGILRRLSFTDLLHTMIEDLSGSPAASRVAGIEGDVYLWPNGSVRLDEPRSEREIYHANLLARHTKVSPAFTGVFEQMVPRSAQESSASLPPLVPTGNRVVYVALGAQH